MPDILIVDDSISVRKALEITLRNQSLSSQSAVSGEQATEMLEQAGPELCELMIVDVIMPGMSGLDFCAWVKKDERFADLPVVLMSGNIDEEIRLQAREAGANGVLKKPFSHDELLPMIEGLLTERRAQKAAQTQESEATATTSHVAEPADDVSTEQTPTQEEGEKLANSDLAALTELLQRYEDHPRVRDVVILDRQGQPIRQMGNVLPENIQMFARFFTNTAGVLGKQMLGEDITDVSIRYGVHEMVIHNLPAHFVVVLMGENGAGNAMQA